MPVRKFLAFPLLALALGSAAADDGRTRFLAANCAYCHGPDGHSHGAIPSLAGLDAGYFIAQMQAFRSGARAATVMQTHALGYNDGEIAALAQWFESHR